MSMFDATSANSPWFWWEKRRLTYNTALFATGWAGFGLEVAALRLWSEQPPDSAYLVLWQGLIYVFYMAAANVLFLLGPAIEAVVKPAPVSTYRQRAWTMGLGLSIALPLFVVVAICLSLAWSAHAG